MKELGFGLGFGVLVAIGFSILSVMPSQGEPVAVFMGPFSTPADGLKAIVSAHGSLLSQSTVVVTASDDPDFIDKLYQAGAWFVGDARALGLCVTGSDGELTYAWN
ncbi:hypothetical protein GR183_11435 [Stappia sp. GBMRC 2046]|uniref:Uncharacterized protein n=1 Tax=Stappia sediminis TaxID=2692190 RepID=A0A7X3LUU6_9HYPH|nr:hypothetical protein [Stappia sediminis]MXN65514.1 hypothetical protein [Stappia sediminis]